MAFDGTLKFDTAIDQTGFKNGIAQLGSLAKKGMEVIAGATAAASGAVAVLGKQAISAYADYEQLTGGVETLFKESASIVMGYAENAFKTAGLSSNEYMETVTGFSAALISSLGGDTLKASKIADMAITDMADNANKMGSTMESIQNAYQGFAKQNYTMLDNLKLGYGGTKSEMERLLADAEKISGIHYDISSYADVVNAIHEIQVSMDITGTTAKEAEHTISGSIGAMKSAWKNLVTGIADPKADLGKLISDFVKTASSAFGNLLPAAKQALAGIGELIKEIAPIIADALPDLISDVLPSLVSAGWELVQGLGHAIIDNLPALLSVGRDLLDTVSKGIIERLPDLMKRGAEMINSFSKSLSDNLPLILDTAIKIISTIGNGLKDNLPLLVDAALTLIESLAEYLGENLPELIPAAIDMILQIIETLTEPENILRLVDAAIAILLGLVDGLLNSLDVMAEDLPKIVDNIVDALIVAAPKLLDAAIEIIAKLAEYLLNPENIIKLTVAAFKIVIKLAEGIVALHDKMRSAAKDLIEAFFNEIGLGGAYKKGKEFIEDFKSGMNDAIESGGFGGALVSGAKGAWNGLKTVVNPVGSVISGFKSLTGHARGGIVTRPELSWIGEDGAEAVIPLENNTEWIDKVADRFALKVAPEAVDALRRQSAYIDSGYTSSPTTDIVNNYSYSTVNNNTEHPDSQPVNIQLIVGDEVLAEGVVDIASDKMDKAQGEKVVLRKRGLA
ncbi:MAG TPA: hypothetical protein P5191_09240 [Ruminococcus sp.]|nr:hypothetical protein [Ruminococcus sp.]